MYCFLHDFGRQVNNMGYVHTFACISSQCLMQSCVIITNREYDYFGNIAKVMQSKLEYEYDYFAFGTTVIDYQYVYFTFGPMYSSTSTITWLFGPMYSSTNTSTSTPKVRVQRVRVQNMISPFLLHFVCL